MKGLAEEKAYTMNRTAIWTARVSACRLSDFMTCLLAEQRTVHDYASVWWLVTLLYVSWFMLNRLGNSAI